MRTRWGRLRILAWAVPLFVGGCADLGVVNPNKTDATGALTSVVRAEALIGAAYNTFFQGHSSYDGPGLFLSDQAFSHNSPWLNAGMEQYGRLPRIGIVNDVTNPYYGNVSRVWYQSYKAIAAASDGLRLLKEPESAESVSPEEMAKLQAFARFTQGMAHAGLALLYDRGFVVDEDTDVTTTPELVGYRTLMGAAMDFLEAAAVLANGSDFLIPEEWIANDLSSKEFARLIHSYKARFMAQVARTSEERADLDWEAISAEVDQGIQDTYFMRYDWTRGWGVDVLGYQTFYRWSQLSYWMYGMADQSGNYQEWLDQPLAEKSYRFPDGRDVLIVTPDGRFPQGMTVEEQMESGEGYFRITPPSEQGMTWKKPERGTWRWSWYKDGVGHRAGYWRRGEMDQPEINITEMDLLKAEALFREGNLASAATLINKTRTLHGLNPTDQTGINSSCVPKLPNGECGGLWEMLKWEKRMETVYTGFLQNNWWFDSRGWGDLWKDTPLQFPIPCQEMQVLQLVPCNSFGGEGGEMGSPGSSYGFPFEW